MHNLILPLCDPISGVVRLNVEGRADGAEEEGALHLVRALDGLGAGLVDPLRQE